MVYNDPVDAFKTGSNIAVASFAILVMMLVFYTWAPAGSTSKMEPMIKGILEVVVYCSLDVPNYDSIHCRGTLEHDFGFNLQFAGTTTHLPVFIRNAADGKLLGPTRALVHRPAFYCSSADELQPCA